MEYRKLTWEQGSQKMQECENCVKDVPMSQTDESWWMTSQKQVTK